MVKNSSNLYSELFFSFMDMAAEIAIAFYVIPANIFVILMIFDVRNYIFFLSLTLGLMIFASHLFLKRGEYKFDVRNFFDSNKNFRTILRLFFTLNLSVFLVISAFALIDPVLKDSLYYLNDFLKITGGVMFMFLYLFAGIIIVSLFRKSLQAIEKKSYIFLIVIIVIFLFNSGLRILSTQEWTQNVGLFLLGSINLLIVKILFLPKSNQ